MVDMHIHSNLSMYGKNSVEKILKKAEKAKLSRISITDCNTALAHIWIENINAKRYFSGEIVPGIELDVCQNGIAFQVLAYGFDVESVQRWAEKKYGNLKTRQEKIKKQLLDLCRKQNFVIDAEFHWNPQEEYAHANVFKMLMKNSKNKEKFGSSLPKSAEHFYLLSTHVTDFPFYIDMKEMWPSLEEAVETIHQYGGIVVLASPFQYRCGKMANKLLEFSIGVVDGIEVYYPIHTKLQVQQLLDYCKANNMKICGGSDYQDLEHISKLAKIKKELLSV